jgi:hypothetical protein
MRSKAGMSISEINVSTPLHFAAIRRCIQKFMDWPPRARTGNGTALCHKVQLYRYFVSQSSEFCAITLCVAPQLVFIVNIGLGAFAASELGVVFSGYQPR